MRRLGPALIHRAAAVLVAASAWHAQAQTTLFDPAAGAPTAQGWQPLVSGAAGSTGQMPGAFTLNTLADINTMHVFSRLSPLALDMAAGFTLSFTVRIASEVHSSPNRAGFSLLVIGSNPAQSLELAFWSNEVFVYDYQAADADRFVHGAGVLRDTTAATTTYSLRFEANQFALQVQGSTVLAGPLVNYTAQGLPYTLPNFISFGDNSSRGQASVELGPIVLSAVPEPASAAILLAGVGVVVLLAWRRGPRR